MATVDGDQLEEYGLEEYTGAGGVVGVGVEGVRGVRDVVVAVAAAVAVVVVTVVTIVADELEEVNVGCDVEVGLVDRSRKDWKVLFILNRLLRFILCGMTPAPVVSDEDEEEVDEELAPKMAVIFEPLDVEVDDVRELVPEAVELVGGCNPGEDEVPLWLLLLLLDGTGVVGEVGDVGEAELEWEDLR